MEACYRHPGRETGVACSNCGRPICTDCMTTTSVGMRCPDCARQKTKVKTMSQVEQPTLTYILIAINVIVGIGVFAGGTGSAGVSPLIEHGAVSRFDLGEGEYWRLLTSGFLHSESNPLHLLFNMFALYVLGTMLEPAVGRLRFGLIYFVSLLAGAFGAVLLEPLAPTVGASGAVFGLMGAAVVVMRNRGISPMESGIGLWIGLNLLITFTVPNISIGGHIGGLIGGALAAFLLFELVDRVRMPAMAATGLTAAIGAISIAGAIAVSS